MAVTWVTNINIVAQCFVVLPVKSDAVFKNLQKLKHSQIETNRATTRFCAHMGVEQT